MGDLLSREGEARITEAGIVIGALGVGGLVYVACVSTLLKLFNRRHFMWVGGVLMIVGPLSLALHLEWQSIAIAFAITGLGFMLLHNSIQTEAVELAPAARQSAYSLHAFCFFTGQASGPPLFGAAVILLGEPAALCICAFILAATGISMSVLFGRLARGE
jgi:predicted MFS family arabinose efflux permease